MAPLPVSVALTAPNGLQYTQPLGLFINNNFVPAKSQLTLPTIDPHNESKIVDVHSAGEADVDLAVQAAREAFNGTWRRMKPHERGDILFKFATLIEAEKHTLATVETWDCGKPIGDCLEIIDDCVRILKYYAGYTDKTSAQSFESTSDLHVYTIREPVGVCGLVVPWNYPLLTLFYKLAPALAAGNTVVVKVAEQTPLSTLYLAALVKQAGFSPGVVNVINGTGRLAGAALASHLDVNKLSFTGSTETGKQIMKLASSNLKRICLETGGKSPMIVFPDANLEKAAHWAHLGIMVSAGQNCTANSRIYVHQSVYDTFLSLFMDKIKSSKLGNPFGEDTFQGPVVSEVQRDRVMEYIKLGQKEGATLYTGGQLWAQRPAGKGYYIEPTVFTDVRDTMRIAREEIFGPVAVIMKFKTEAEVVKRANDTIYGLGAAVFTKDVSRVHRVAKKIESGTVWANSSNSPMDVRVPFGGMKQSGLGHELGQVGIESFTTLRSVYVTLEEEELETGERTSRI